VITELEKLAAELDQFKAALLDRRSGFFIMKIVPFSWMQIQGGDKSLEPLDMV